MLSTVTVAERPDLIDAMWALPNLLPAFMDEDPVASVYFGRLPVAFPAYQILLVDDDEVVGMVHSLPFHWAGTDDDLPDRGWDAILERGFADYDAGRAPNAVSLLEAVVASSLRGTGLSTRLLTAARENASREGLADLFGPVRPTGKAAEPRTPMKDYISRVRLDGLPADPWLRVHVRLGARIVKVCPLSMIIPGTLSQWREWTSDAFDQSGDVDVAGALVPVHVSVEHDYAVYVEPNVWVHHKLG